MSRLLPIFGTGAQETCLSTQSCLVASRNRSELIGTESSSLPNYFPIPYSIETFLYRAGRVQVRSQLSSSHNWWLVQSLVHAGPVRVTLGESTIPDPQEGQEFDSNWAFSQRLVP
jgi:hypothetical protein